MSLRRRGRSLAFLAAIAVVWEGGKAFFAIPTYKLPHLHEIFGDFLRQGAGGERWAWIMAYNAGYTALESLVGFVLGSAAGLALAVLFAHSRLLERGFLPYVIASQTVPILAIAPMVVVWLGTGWVSKAVIAAYLTFFPVTINMLRGLRAVEPDALALMRALAASPRQVFCRLRLPAAVPYLFTALRISATVSVVGAIVGELPVGSRYGMGVVIINAAPEFAEVVLPYAIASAAVPIVALAPLAIVWFGIGQPSKIAIVTSMTFFPTFVSTLRGLDTVPLSSLELMRSYAATEWQVFAKLRLPHSLPYVFTALRACTTLAMIGAVVSEFFGGPVKSLGVYIKSTASLFQTRQAWSAILVACGLGLAFYFAVVLTERLVMPWCREREPI